MNLIEDDALVRQGRKEGPRVLHLPAHARQFAVEVLHEAGIILKFIILYGILYVMSQQWTIILRDGSPVSATQTDPSGGVLRRVEPVWTLKELCRRAGKSRRQIYRDLREGRLQALGKFLGEWLVDAAELHRLRPLPPSLASVLPEYETSVLDPERDRDLLLSRILRFGGRERLRWAFSFYGRDALRRFVREKAPTLLDRRSYGFWRLIFALPSQPCPKRRLKGRRWGGAA